MDIPALLRAIVVIAAAYLIGSIPWGVIVARVSGGPDPRKIGSGRTGGSNVMRALGARLALLSGMLDVAKGAAAVLVALWLGVGVPVEMIAAMMAIVGHSRSVFLNFGGGRGIAPAFGALLVVDPIVAAAIIPVFFGLILLTRYSSVGSLAASATGGVLLAVLTVVTPLDPWHFLFAVGGPALIWIFHYDNIGRLLAGTERRIGTPRT